MAAEFIDRRFPPELIDLAALPLGLLELTPVVCQIDNAMFSCYLPDEMTFDRGGVGHRIADGKRECNFVWELTAAKPNGAVKALADNMRRRRRGRAAKRISHGTRKAADQMSHTK